MKAEWEINKLTVIGKFDASKLREKLADKTKKKIDIVSSSSEKKKEKDEKAEDKKAEEKKPKEKEVTCASFTLRAC